MAFQVGQNEADLQRQYQNTTAAIKARGGNAPGYEKRLAAIKQAMGNMGVQPDRTAPRLGKLPKNIKNVRQGVQTEQQVADFVAGKNQQLQNPNQYNPFGSQTVSTDEYGNVSINQQLSPEQQRILDYENQITGTARGLAAQRLNAGTFGSEFNPELAARTATGDLLADRARIEEETYGRLTRNLDRDYQAEKERREQTLMNRGIALRPDDPTYQAYMQDLEDNYNQQKEAARGQAVQFGGDEFARSFGIGEQLRANQFSEQQGIRNQQFGEIGSLGQMGLGLQLPQFQAYNPIGYALTSPIDVSNQLAQIRIAQQNANTSRMAASRVGGGGGGAPAPAQPQSPFVTG